jgi:hypothetical protein
MHGSTFERIILPTSTHYCRSVNILLVLHFGKLGNICILQTLLLLNLINMVRCSSEEAASGVRVVLPASAVQQRPDRPADTERQRRRRPPGNHRGVQDLAVDTAASKGRTRKGGGDSQAHSPGEHQLELVTLTYGVFGRQS